MDSVLVLYEAFRFSVRTVQYRAFFTRCAPLGTLDSPLQRSLIKFYYGKWPGPSVANESIAFDQETASS